MPPPLIQQPSAPQDNSETLPPEDSIMQDDPTEGEATNHRPLCPNINDFIFAIGPVKTELVQKLHCMTMTALIGSIGTYVKTIDLKLKFNRIKLALKSTTMEKKASSIATWRAKERTADKPTLSGVVNKGVKQHTSQIERRLQSLEFRLGNTSKPKTNQNGHLKDQHGANGGAAATKKSDSAPSSCNSKANDARLAGGSRAGSRQGRSASNAGKSPSTSGRKSNAKKTKNNKSKARS